MQTQWSGIGRQRSVLLYELREIPHGYWNAVSITVWERRILRWRPSRVDRNGSVWTKRHRSIKWWKVRCNIVRVIVNYVCNCKYVNTPTLFLLFHILPKPFLITDLIVEPTATIYARSRIKRGSCLKCFSRWWRNLCAFITGSPNGPVLFCSLASVICHRM